MTIVGLRYGVQRGEWEASKMTSVSIRNEDGYRDGTETTLKAEIANGLVIDYLLVLTSDATAMMIDLNKRTVYAVKMKNKTGMGFELFFDIAWDFEREITAVDWPLENAGYNFVGNIRDDDTFSFKLGETTWWMRRHTPEEYEATEMFFVEFADWLKGLGYVFKPGTDVTYKTIDFGKAN